MGYGGEEGVRESRGEENREGGGKDIEKVEEKEMEQVEEKEEVSVTCLFFKPIIFNL